MSMHRRTETQVKQYIRQFHSVHLADIITPASLPLPSTDRFEAVELVLVGGGDGDELCAWLEVLSNVARVSPVLVESPEQRHLVVHVRQLDTQPHVNVQRVRRSVLQTPGNRPYRIGLSKV